MWPGWCGAQTISNLDFCDSDWLVPEAWIRDDPGQGFQVGHLQTSGIRRTFISDTEPAATANAAVAIRDYLIDASRFYQKIGLNPPETNCTGDPDYVAVVVSPQIPDALGSYTAHCVEGGAPTNNRSIELSAKELSPVFSALAQSETALVPSITPVNASYLSTPAHELFHAVFYNSDLGESRCEGISDWVAEGMADAFGYLWMENADHRFGSWVASSQRRTRQFSLPLHMPQGEPISEHDARYDSTLHYETWWFWKFLGDQYDKNPMEQQIVATERHRYYVGFYNDYANYMSNPQNACREEPKPDSTQHWDLDWLDKVLKCWINNIGDKPTSVEGGLYVLYPRFAAWLLDRFVMIDKVEKVFANYGCHKVKLVTGQTSINDISIREVATECVEVQLDTTKSDLSFTVSVEDAGGSLENIHLGNSMRALEPARMDAGGKWKAWHIFVEGGTAKIWLALSNVAPVALETKPAENLEFRFDYMSAGSIQ